LHVKKVVVFYRARLSKHYESRDGWCSRESSARPCWHGVVCLPAEKTIATMARVVMDIGPAINPPMEHRRNKSAGLKSAKIKYTDKRGGLLVLFDKTLNASHRPQVRRPRNFWRSSGEGGKLWSRSVFTTELERPKRFDGHPSGHPESR